ncbi:hypothetical protein DM860_016643 [Cuscuta australis]|uniref:Uncharacterized protein n=1 Tax=Cuscuta australis TaxID=267555 RepID=A0A328DLT0_9ASTE|nr:hypothetical protein DM860_016643 [Cuscuta australis]
MNHRQDGGQEPQNLQELRSDGDGDVILVEGFRVPPRRNPGDERAVVSGEGFPVHRSRAVGVRHRLRVHRQAVPAPSPPLLQDWPHQLVVFMNVKELQEFILCESGRGDKGGDEQDGGGAVVQDGVQTACEYDDDDEDGPPRTRSSSSSCRVW